MAHIHSYTQRNVGFNFAQTNWNYPEEKSREKFGNKEKNGNEDLNNSRPLCKIGEKRRGKE